MTTREGAGDDDRADRVGEFTYTRYPPRLPALRDGRDPTTSPVAIVGGGPVGMALALGLANWGVRSVVIEADESVCVGSRAACISRRSLEIIDRLGALPAFLAKGLAWTGGRSFYTNEEVFRFEMPHDERQRLPPMINLQQYYIEQYLVDAIERRKLAGNQPSVDIRWGSEVTGFSPQADGIDIRVCNRLGDYAMRCDWMVACDGGQSLVRKTLGLPLVGTAYEGRYVIIDVHLPSQHPTERRAWFDPPWNPGSTVLMHRQADDIWRIDYQLRVGEDTDTALQPENVRRFVQKHLDSIGEGHLPWETIWTSVYRAGAMTLESYRHGRILFAGNAAHAMPIFGVRGLNSGFDDADNLAWKLALVVKGTACAALLDSYSQERISAFHINAASAMRSTEFMSPPSRGFELLREAVLSLAGAHPDIAGLINPRQTEAVSYIASPLSTPDSTRLPGAGPGVLLPDFPLAEPTRHLTELLEPAFALLVFSRAGAIDDALEAALGQAAWRDLVPLQPILVRLAGANAPSGGRAPRSSGHPSRFALSRQAGANAPSGGRAPRSSVHPSRFALSRQAGANAPSGGRAPRSWLVVTAEPAIFDAQCPQGDALYLLRPDRHVAARWRLQAHAPAGLGDAILRACGAAHCAMEKTT